MNNLSGIFTAILDDDRVKAKKLLKAEPALATAQVDEARLYNEKIFHWIYVGDTALHLAAAGYRVEIVGLLLEAGADSNAQINHRESTPLHYAADGFITGPDWNATRQVQTIECLVAAGAEIDAQDKNGATALHRAVRTRCAGAVKYFLENDAAAKAKNKSGSTPFHLAVQNTGRGGSGATEAKAAQRKIIEIFLAHGLKPTLKDGKGKSVLECATSGWIREMLSKS